MAHLIQSWGESLCSSGESQSTVGESFASIHLLREKKKSRSTRTGQSIRVWHLVLEKPVQYFLAGMRTKR